MKESLKDISIEKHEDFQGPSEEILRPNEKVKEITDSEIQTEISKLKEKGEISDRFFNFVNRWTKRALVAQAILWGSYGLHEGIEYYNQLEPKAKFSRNETPYIPEKGSVPEIVIYGHEDNRTDAILNYLSGKEPLPESMKDEMEVRLFFSEVFNRYEYYKNNIDNPEEKTRMTPAFIEYMENIQPKIDKWSKVDPGEYKKTPEFVEEAVEWEFASIPNWFYKVKAIPPQWREYAKTKLDQIRLCWCMGGPVSFEEKWETIGQWTDEEFKQKIANKNRGIWDLFRKQNFSVKKYDTFWTLQLKYGNPKIDISQNFSKRMSYGSRAFYRPSINTMYLGVNKDYRVFTKEDWLAELSHAEQYGKYSPEFMEKREEIERAYLKLMSVLEDSNKDVLTNQSKEWGDLKDRYLYKTPGTIEYEAHEQIEPEIRKEFEEKIKEEENS